jgi:UDP-2,3-diacylglucosamine pyrophosphatase LpxH
MMNLKTVVISDIHIGAGKLDDCDDALEAQLCNFFKMLSSNDIPVELVINGDFLEFIQAPPWQGETLRSKTKDDIRLCFTERQSVLKLENIIQAHGAVFKGLEEFLASKQENRLVIVPGNHDADFFWPEVRQKFAETVCGMSDRLKNRLFFHLEQGYAPTAHSGIWIEHGHQYDPINSFFLDGKPCWSQATPPIFDDVSGTPRLLECLGTRFLIKYINKLDSEYHFVDNVKPFGKFLTIFGASAFTPGYGPLKAAAAVWGMLRYLSSTLVHSPGDLLDFSGKGNEDPKPLLLAWQRQLTEEERRGFKTDLNKRGYPLDRSLELHVSDSENAEKLMDFLSENLDLADIRRDEDSYLGAEKGFLSLYRGFKVDETAQLVEAAEKKIKEAGTKAVVMGHTHAEVDRPDLAYFNTGCWTRYLNFNEVKDKRPWSILKDDSYALFPYKLNFVEIDPGQPSPIRKSTFKQEGL